MTACPQCGFESEDAFRFCPSCGAELSLGPRETRKTVTVLFSDVVGSTRLGEALDPEVLRRVMGRYFEEARSVLERHGGTLEKFIGDAVVALFGVPVSREDDALRALRAADELRTRLEALNDEFERTHSVRIAVRTGVNTGEVVVGETGLDGFRASGDTMNVAARLEQSAAPGEILIGALTRRLGGDAIVAEQREPLEVKGKAAPLEAFRLDEVLSDTAPFRRRDDAGLVGRRHELAVLGDALRRASASRECVLVTFVGAAGVGKSRLVREFLATLDETACVLVGRCVAYGEGITFLPLAEALSPVLGDDVRGSVLELFARDARAASIADQVASALGAGSAGGSTEETFWAFRRLLEALAHERPLVLVVDDVHWAEPMLLDLLEYVAGFSAGAPILVICLTRPDLLDERPTWAAPRENGTVASLAPLGGEEALALVEQLSGERVYGSEELRRIVDAADGNPLFLEQLLALNVGGEGELVVPPTIQALLAARIDQLEPGERRVLECASIEGREFQRGSLSVLLSDPERPNIGRNLLALARRQFIRPHRAADPAEDTFAFVHALMRDAAYEAMPMARRADLHLQLADDLDERSGAAGEIVGQHLAEAASYRRELGYDDETTSAIAARAADLLAVGGQRALSLGDDRAAAKLFERACELVPVDEVLGMTLRVELGRALAGAAMFERSRDVFVDVRAAARDAGERALELRAELGLLGVRTSTDVTLSMAEVAVAAEQAIPVFEAAGDERGLARSWFLLHWVRFRTGRCEESIVAAEQIIKHFARSGDEREPLRALGAIAMATLWGPTPVDEAFRRCDELVERAGGARLVEAFADRVRGGLCSMNGEFELGREHCRRAVEIYEELGHTLSAVGVVSERQRIERQNGRLDVAERDLRGAYERLRELGDIGYVSWVAAQLARVLAERGQHEEACELARTCREDLQRDHAFAQIAARLAEATAFAAESRNDEAEARISDALFLVEATDMLDLHGDVHIALAELDCAAGRRDSASQRAKEAIALYERKGDVVSAARVRERGYLPG